MSATWRDANERRQISVRDAIYLMLLVALMGTIAAIASIRHSDDEIRRLQHQPMVCQPVNGGGTDCHYPTTR